MNKILHFLLVVTVCSFSCSAHAEVSFDTYIEPPPHETLEAIRACVSDLKKSDECIGITVRSCMKTAPQSQCNGVEAAAWQVIGYDFYRKISRKISKPEILEKTHNNLVGYRDAQCTLEEEIHRDDPVFQRLSSAICSLQLTAQYVLRLRGYVVDLNEPLEFEK